MTFSHIIYHGTTSQVELFSNGCSPGDIHQGASVTRALHSFHVGVSVGWYSEIAFVDTEVRNMTDHKPRIEGVPCNLNTPIIMFMFMFMVMLLLLLLLLVVGCWLLVVGCWLLVVGCWLLVVVVVVVVVCCCWRDDGLGMVRALPVAGELGDCWFLSAIACLSAREEKKPKEKQMKDLHLDMNWLWLKTDRLNPCFGYLETVK